jgi:hypothetical protein
MKPMPFSLLNAQMPARSSASKVNVIFEMTCRFFSKSNLCIMELALGHFLD